MNKSNQKQRRISLGQRIAIMLFGLFITAVTLEIGLRISGFIALSLQEQRNLQSIKEKDVCRIMCLGESTTAGQYPEPLEEILNQRNSGVKFSVIDKGRANITTVAILSKLEANLNKYQPDIVVVMMGCNDKGVRYYQDISEANTWIFRHCRLYRFGRIIYMHILKKIKKEGIYGLNRLDSGRKAKLENTGTVAEKINLLNERPIGKITKLNSQGDKKSPGLRSAYLNRSKPPESEESLKQAIELNPKNDNAYLELGRLYRDQGKFSQAEDSFKQAIDLNPKNDYAYLELGLIYRDQSKFLQAEESFKKAIELNPKNDNVYLELGWLYKAQGKLVDSDRAFKKAIELNPKNDNAYLELGRLYQDQGNFPQAEESFKKAIELNPKNDNAYLELGWIYRDQGNFFQAEDSFKKAIELNPKNDYVYLELGWLYKAQGKLVDSDQAFKKAIEFNPKNDNAYVRLGRLYRVQGQFPQAEESFKKAIEINPKNGNVYNAILVLYEEIGKPELAKEYAEKANRLGVWYYNLLTVNNYRKLKQILDKRGIRLVCVQYPMRNVEPLKRIFEKDEGVIFVDNETIFKEAVKKSGLKEVFKDMFGGDFGHCTPKGNRLLARNIADTILKEIFGK